MRIIQVIARVNRGGTARWIKELIVGLRANGDEVFLVAGNIQADELEDPCFLELNGHRIESLGRSISLISDIKALIEIRSFIIETKPDLINTHTAKAGVIGRLAVVTILRNRPALVHTYHGHLLYGYFPEWKTKIFVLIERFLAQFTNVLIAAGDRVKRDLIAVGIGDDEKFQVLRPGVQDFNHLEKGAVRATLNIPEKKIVVGWLARIARIKRLDRVIELGQNFPEVIFLIGGEGEGLDEFKSVASQNIYFLGWTNPETIWSASDIALLTSDNEAQPIALIEAGYSSLPIVAQNVGSVSEVVENGKTGYLVSNFSESVVALDKLINSDELRQKFGAAGRDSILHRFSPDQFISGHSLAYIKALKDMKS